MKLRLTYLLLLGLLFCKGYSFTTASNQADLSSQTSVQKLYNNSSLCFTDCSNENILSVSSLFMEDTDDDEYSCNSKKVSYSRDNILPRNTGLVISRYHSFKKYTSAGKAPEYSFPHRYLLTRSIRV